MPLPGKSYRSRFEQLREFLRAIQICNLSIILFFSYAKTEINDQKVYLVQIEAAESGGGKK